MKRRNFLYSMFGMLATPFFGLKKAECESFPVGETVQNRFRPHKEVMPKTSGWDWYKEPQLVGSDEPIRIPRSFILSKEEFTERYIGPSVHGWLNCEPPENA